MKPVVSAGWAALAVCNTGAVSGMTGYVKGYSRAQAAFDLTKIDMSGAVGASVAFLCFFSYPSGPSPARASRERSENSQPQ